MLKAASKVWGFYLFFLLKNQNAIFLTFSPSVQGFELAALGIAGLSQKKAAFVTPRKAVTLIYRGKRQMVLTGKLLSCRYRDIGSLNCTRNIGSSAKSGSMVRDRAIN